MSVAPFSGSLKPLSIVGERHAWWKSPPGASTNSGGSLWSVESGVTSLAPPLMTGATLRGVVNPHGCATKYHFEYGRTKKYVTARPRSRSRRPRHRRA
jgi:hypothetical protein